MHKKLIAVGTPDALRAAPAGGPGAAHVTAIQLAVVTDAVVAAASSAARADVTVAGRTLTVPVAKPERDNPELVAAVVALTAIPGAALYIALLSGAFSLDLGKGRDQAHPERLVAPRGPAK